MKKIIALQGNSSHGKTTTLRLLIEKIRTSFPIAPITYLKRWNGAKQDYPASFSEYMNKQDDRVVIFEINSIKIAIITYGDPSSNEELRIYLEGVVNIFKCDLIFCACHFDKKSVGWINAYNPPYELEFIKQTFDRINSEAVNQAMADKLFAMI